MKGPAGVGKTAVAQTSVEMLKRQGRSCLAFFFSINGRNKSQKFFPSIAYQLASLNSDYCDLINRKISHNKTLVDKTMETQFWGLIVEPLQELQEMGKGVGERIPVFVDGLDECEGQDAQCQIIEIVASAARDGGIPLCWAFFSRPSPRIEAAFSKFSAFCHMTVLPISRDADGDIELYLRAGFKEIFRRLHITIDSPWPSDSKIKQIVGAAGGLFIYAKAVLRFVGESGSYNPDELLRAIIAMISNRGWPHTNTLCAFSELDALYTLVMQHIPIEILSVVQQILAILCWTSSSGALTIANLLGLSRVELEAACSQLSAVVCFQREYKPLKLDSKIDTSQSFLFIKQDLGISNVIQESLGGSISLYHKSFQDFLCDRRRSGIYCINNKTISRLIYEAEWNLVLLFQNSHCWQGSGMYT